MTTPTILACCCLSAISSQTLEDEETYKVKYAQLE